MVESVPDSRSDCAQAVTVRAAVTRTIGTFRLSIIDKPRLDVRTLGASGSGARVGSGDGRETARPPLRVTITAKARPAPARREWLSK